MSASDPRIEFRPGPELKKRLEAFQALLHKKAGRHYSMSKVVSAALAEFFKMDPNKR